MSFISSSQWVIGIDACFTLAEDLCAFTVHAGFADGALPIGLTATGARRNRAARWRPIGFFTLADRFAVLGWVRTFDRAVTLVWLRAIGRYRWCFKIRVAHAIAIAA